MPGTDPIECKLCDWIEASLDCEVLGLERQQRWRPCWFIDVRCADGTQKSLYARGERSIYVPESLDSTVETAFRNEYGIMRILEDEGLPVPHVYGMCPDPMVILTDRATGRADLSTATSEEERSAVLEQYMAALARIHAIEVGRFDSISIPRPSSPERLPLTLIDTFEPGYREAKNRPEPVIEFLLQWVKRNAPRDRTRATFLVCDVAQFMFENGELTALIDFEMAQIGDPVQDLAALQSRDTTEPLGDIAQALRVYESITGQPIDPAAFDFYTIVFALNTPLAMTKSISQSLPTNSVIQYFEWWVNFCRISLEVIAGITGRTLPEIEPVMPEMPLFGTFAESLTGAIGALPAADDFAKFERDGTARLARFVERIGQLGPAIARQNIADVEALVGSSFPDWQSADAALESFVLSAGPEEDDRLIPLLYARARREWELLAPFFSRPEVDAGLKTYSELMEG